MNCGDELKLRRLVDDRHEMERLLSAVDDFDQFYGGESVPVDGSVDDVRLVEILEAFDVLIQEKLESAL